MSEPPAWSVLVRALFLVMSSPGLKGFVTRESESRATSCISSSSYKGINSLTRTLPSSPSTRHYLPKAPPPYTILSRISTCEFRRGWGGTNTVHSKMIDVWLKKNWISSEDKIRKIALYLLPEGLYQRHILNSETLTTQEAAREWTCNIPSLEVWEHWASVCEASI